VPRGINDVDPVTFPVTGSGSRSDGYAALLLLGHPVHNRCTFIYLSYLVGNTCSEKDTLCRGSLPRIDMGHNPDVSDLSDWMSYSQLYTPFLL
jgi:hypothetical protein